MAEDVEQRLTALERRLDGMEQALADEREAAVRRQRMGVYVRIGVLVVIVLFYYVYLKSVSSMG